MSLDVYLTMPDAIMVQSTSGIFIRDNGQTKEISDQEWNAKNPDREAVRVQPESLFTDEVYSANITHNLCKMAAEAGVYKVLWRPDEVGITKAKELIDKLELGLDVLKSDPDHFKQFNPINGWGNYDGLVRFVENYLNACREYPDAEIRVSR